MPRLLRMPEVAAGATEAVLAEWLVAEQAEFAAGGTLATVETDKAMVDVEAEDAGVVLKTLVPPGAHVEVGAPIAVLGQPGEVVADLAAVLADLGVAAPAAAGRARGGGRARSGGRARRFRHPAPPAAPAGAAGNGRVFASPLARKIARQSGLPVEAITGTGPGGRILRRDVEAAIAGHAAAPPATPAGPAIPARPATAPARPATTPARPATAPGPAPGGRATAVRSRTAASAAPSPPGWWPASRPRRTSTCGRLSGPSGWSRCGPRSTPAPTTAPGCPSTTWSSRPRPRRTSGSPR